MGFHTIAGFLTVLWEIDCAHVWTEKVIQVARSYVQVIYDTQSNFWNVNAEYGNWLLTSKTYYSVVLLNLTKYKIIYKPRLFI